MEATTPASSLPSKEELLAFQARWLRRAGLAGLIGAFIVAASIVLQQAGLTVPSGKSDADQLVFEHAHSSRLIYSSILQAIGLMRCSSSRCSSSSAQRTAARRGCVARSPV